MLGIPSGMLLAGCDHTMVRLEQVRGEMIDRFERIDRRFAQNDQRVGRMEQRLVDIADRLDAMRRDVLRELDALARIARELGVVIPDEFDDSSIESVESDASVPDCVR